MLNYTPILVNELPKKTTGQIDETSALIMVSETDIQNTLSSYAVGYADLVNTISNIANNIQGTPTVFYNVLDLLNTQTLNIIVASKAVYYFVFQNTDQGSLTLNFEISTLSESAYQLNLVFITNGFNSSVTVQLNGNQTTQFNLTPNAISTSIGTISNDYLVLSPPILSNEGGDNTLIGLSDVQITNPQNHDSLFYDPTTRKWVNEQPSAGETFKGLLDVLGDNFETGFLNVPDNGYVATATTGANIDNRSLTQNKTITNANVVANQITFYCGLNPPGGTNPNLVINPINQVILINATTFTNIQFNVDLSSTALNPTGFTGQGTMTNSVDITLYIGLSGTASNPFTFSVQGEQKFVWFPEQYLVLSLRLSNQGFPNAVSIDNNTNFYSRVEYLGFKYIPAVAITTTNPTAITFSSVDNYAYYFVNDFNKKAAQTGYHCSYFKLPATKDLDIYNQKFYDVFNTKQYTLTGYNDTAIGFIPDPLTGRIFTESNCWSLSYPYNATLESQIIARLPNNSYLPLFCSIKPLPASSNIGNLFDPLLWSTGTRITNFLYKGNILQANFLDQIENFFMVLVDNANNFWYARYINSRFDLVAVTGAAAAELSAGYRQFQFYINDLLFINNSPQPYPWTSNINNILNNGNAMRLTTSGTANVSDYLYPPMFIQGAFTFNNTGTVLNSIGINFFSGGIGEDLPSLNLAPKVVFPQKAMVSNMYTYTGNAWSVNLRNMFQSGIVPTYLAAGYSSLNVPFSNYFI
jgi:hypothetical protein